MLSFFPRDVLDEIWDLIESVSEGFPTYSFLSVISTETDISILLLVNTDKGIYFPVNIVEGVCISI